MTLVIIVVVVGADWLLVTVAVLVILPIFCGVTMMVMLVEVSGSSIPKLQVIVPDSCWQPVDAEMKVTSGGSVSVRSTFVAGSGPRLVTVIW